MHELISPISAIDPLVTSQYGVCCKRTSVSHPALKLHSLDRCCLVFRTPYACSPAIDCSVLIVAWRACIVALGSVSTSSDIGGGSSFRTLLELSSRFYRVCVQIPG